MRKKGKQDKESATTSFLALSSRLLTVAVDKRETRFPMRLNYGEK